MQMFRFRLSLGAARGNVRPPAPDGRHDAQLLADFLERGVLGEPLESVDHRLLIRHNLDTTVSLGPAQEVGNCHVGNCQQLTDDS